MLFWSVGCLESKLPWSLTFVCFSSYDLVASPFAVVLCRVGNYYWESRCTMVAINLIGMGFVFPIFYIYFCLRVVSGLSCWPSLTFVGLCCPSLFFVSLCRHASACASLRRSLSAFFRKWQFLITFSTESNHRGEGMGGQKAPNLD